MNSFFGLPDESTAVVVAAVAPDSAEVEVVLVPALAPDLVPDFAPAPERLYLPSVEDLVVVVAAVTDFVDPDPDPDPSTVPVHLEESSSSFVEYHSVDYHSHFLPEKSPFLD